MDAPVELVVAAVEGSSDLPTSWILVWVEFGMEYLGMLQFEAQQLRWVEVVMVLLWQQLSQSSAFLTIDLPK